MMVRLSSCTGHHVNIRAIDWDGAGVSHVSIVLCVLYVHSIMCSKPAINGDTGQVFPKNGNQAGARSIGMQPNKLF